MKFYAHIERHVFYRWIIKCARMRFRNIHCLTIDVLQRLASLERTNFDAIHRTWYYDGFKIAAILKSASPRSSSLLEKLGRKRSIGYKRQKDEVTPHHPILSLLVYVWCDKIDNRNNRIKKTRQEYPKQSLYPTIRQPNSFISWHHIRRKHSIFRLDTHVS